MSMFRPTVIAFSLVLLSACGGGGGGGGVAGGGAGMPPPPPPPPPPPLVESLPAALVDATGARTRITGQPLSMDGDAIRGALASRADAPATPLLSDVVNVSLPDAKRDPATCSGRSCTADITDDNASNINFNLDRFGNPPTFDTSGLARFNQEYEAVMINEGVNLAQSQAAGRTSDTDDGTVFHYQSYGGWLGESVFAVQISTGGIGGNDQGILLFSYSFGNPSPGNPPTTADLTWNGVVIGRNIETNRVVQGDAEVMFRMSTPNMLDHVDFSNVINLNDGTSVTFDSASNLRFENITLDDGAFMLDNSANGNISYIRGRFYGTNHEEVGGVFDSHGIVGAFGAN